MPDKFGKTPTKVFESEDKYNEWKLKEPNSWSNYRFFYFWCGKTPFLACFYTIN